jgi:hypothetical protein
VQTPPFGASGGRSDAPARDRLTVFRNFAAGLRHAVTDRMKNE